ncbi:Putative membrane protein insertion efficiency factor [Frankliniella fusca]|uniref:Membrane protein insertion efficiency factor n=1 Tax=Frankliniella fusca TaxID=407009 RepID=A0AAE1GUL3_9NEOP|nr:Putative membrane protein insertion efficiency factor [Frankliniella fusca]
MLDLDIGMPNTWRAISCAEISQLFKNAFTIFRSFFMTIIFLLSIFPAHPYHLTKVTKLSMNSSHFLYDSGSWGSNSGASFNQTMQ